MISKGKPDYEFVEDGINFRVFYVEEKVIVKAKQGNYMVIQYGDSLPAVLNKAKMRLKNMKAPLN